MTEKNKVTLRVWAGSGGVSGYIDRAKFTRQLTMSASSITGCAPLPLKDQLYVLTFQVP